MGSLSREQIVVSWFHGFKDSWFLGFRVSESLGFKDSKNPSMLLKDILFISPSSHFMFLVDIDLITTLLKILLYGSADFSARVFSNMFQISDFQF